MPARRGDVILRLAQNFERPRFGVTFFFLDDLRAQTLARQRLFDENHVAVQSRQAFCAKRQRFNFQFELRAFFQCHGHR
jgi:hypothetical protein